MSQVLVLARNRFHKRPLIIRNAFSRIPNLFHPNQILLQIRNHTPASIPFLSGRCLPGFLLQKINILFHGFDRLIPRSPAISGNKRIGHSSTPATPTPLRLRRIAFAIILPRSETLPSLRIHLVKPSQQSLPNRRFFRQELLDLFFPPRQLLTPHIGDFAHSRKMQNVLEVATSDFDFAEVVHFVGEVSHEEHVESVFVLQDFVGWKDGCFVVGGYSNVNFIISIGCLVSGWKSLVRDIIGLALCWMMTISEIGRFSLLDRDSPRPSVQHQMTPHRSLLDGHLPDPHVRCQSIFVQSPQSQSLLEIPARSPQMPQYVHRARTGFVTANRGSGTHRRRRHRFGIHLSFAGVLVKKSATHRRLLQTNVNQFQLPPPSFRVRFRHGRDASF
mmetsp:Transcript_4682/g.8629  ORF Transcript_4682/g.8629 Transcript_4682/m.8629 type:complete len:388 (+) Transcript_4682:106-1269(+)